MKKMSLVIAALCLCAGVLHAQSNSQTQTFETSAGPVKITPMIHASTMIQAGNKLIYVDPARLPSTDGLAPADFVLISDIHGDQSAGRVDHREHRDLCAACRAENGDQRSGNFQRRN